MNTRPILTHDRVHCFYKDAYGLSGDMSVTALPRTYAPDPNIKPGASDEYDNTIKKYDSSVNFAELRRAWINGVDITIDNIIAEVKTEEMSPESEKTNIHQNKKITRLQQDIRDLIIKRDKLPSTAAYAGKFRRYNRMIDNAQQMIDEYTAEIKKYKMLKTTGTIASTASEQKNTQEAPSTESTSLSDAREALAAERMGRNRPAMVHQLRTIVDRLENSTNRQQPGLNRDNGPENDLNNIINESISLARPTGDVTEDNIFEHLQLLQWRDKDEFKMTLDCLNRIPKRTLYEMYPIMTRLACNLRAAIADSTGAVESLEEDDRNNFLFHVMAKGKDIYYQSLCDPDFCIYMIDNWQPLYSFIKKKLSVDR